MRMLGKATTIALLWFGGVASAQSVQVTVAAPVIHFEAEPALVEVSPGVMVVPDYGEEVFFVSGWYWCRRDGVWFRTRDYHGGWVMAPRGYVPRRLYRIPPGRYRQYHARPGMYRHPGVYRRHEMARPVTRAYPVSHGYASNRGAALARPAHGGGRGRWR